MEDLNLSLISPGLHDQAREAFQSGDAVGILISMDNLKCLQFVFDNVLALKERGILETAIVHAYTIPRINLANVSLSDLTWLFDMADRTKLLGNGNHLPEGEQFTLYRGVAGRSPFRKPSGYSWTDDQQRAVWFARRYPSLERPAVCVTTVKRDEILFFDHGRHERDFVFRTRKYRQIPVEKFQMWIGSGLPIGLGELP